MLRILCLILAFTFTAAAEQRRTAFQAYTLIPREAALRLAKIAACEGASQPERWHFIVHEPQAENGLRDYVVANGRLASTNGASQFTEEVHVEDVLVLNSVRIDSAFAAQVAMQYAAANSAAFASLNYELHKDHVGGPVWKITCLDSSNHTLGWLLIDAGNGNVVEQHGFPITPTLRPNLSGEPTAQEPDIGAVTRELAETPAPVPSHDPADNQPNNPPPGGFHPPSPTAQSNDDPRPPASRPRDILVRRAIPIEREPPPPRRKFLDELFKPGKKLFPF